MCTIVVERDVSNAVSIDICSKDVLSTISILRFLHLVLLSKLPPDWLLVYTQAITNHECQIGTNVCSFVVSIKVSTNHVGHAICIDISIKWSREEVFQSFVISLDRTTPLFSYFDFVKLFGVLKVKFIWSAQSNRLLSIFIVTNCVNLSIAVKISP